MEDITPVDPTKKESPEDKILENLLSSIAKSWKEVASNFTTKTNSTIVKNITKMGFKHFGQDVNIQYIKNMQGGFFDDYASMMARQIELPTAQQPAFKNYFEQLKWADENVWSMFRTMYSVDKGGDCKYVCILGMHNTAENKYSFLVANIKA